MPRSPEPIRQEAHQRVAANDVVERVSRGGDVSLTTDEACQSHLQNTTLDDQAATIMGKEKEETMMWTRPTPRT